MKKLRTEVYLQMKSWLYQWNTFHIIRKKIKYQKTAKILILKDEDLGRYS